jgi:hypothetical protein
MNSKHAVTESQAAIIASAIKLRARVWCLHYESGAWFAQALASEWNASGVAGIGNACRDLQAELQNVVGAHECFAQARKIASQCGVFA